MICALNFKYFRNLDCGANWAQYEENCKNQNTKKEKKNSLNRNRQQNRQSLKLDLFLIYTLQKQIQHATLKLPESSNVLPVVILSPAKYVYI